MAVVLLGVVRGLRNFEVAAAVVVVDPPVRDVPRNLRSDGLVNGYGFHASPSSLAEVRMRKRVYGMRCLQAGSTHRAGRRCH